MNGIARGLRALGAFLFDFLFGDSLVLLPATIAIAAIAFGLRHERTVDTLVVPALVLVLVMGSAWRGRRRPVTADPVEPPID